MYKKAIIPFLVLALVSCSSAQSSFDSSIYYGPLYAPETSQYDLEYLAAMRYVIAPNLSGYPDLEINDNSWMFLRKYTYSHSNYNFECKCFLDGYNSSLRFHVTKEEEYRGDIKVYLSDKVEERAAYITDYDLYTLKDFYLNGKYRLTFVSDNKSFVSLVDGSKIDKTIINNDIESIKEDLSFYVKKALVDTVNFTISAYEEAISNNDVEYYNTSLLTFKYPNNWENYRTQHYLDYIYSNDEGYRVNN